MLPYRVKTWATTKREEGKIQAKEMKFLRAILKKTKEMIRNTKDQKWSTCMCTCTSGRP